MTDLSAMLAGLDGFDWDLGNSGKNLGRHRVTDGKAEDPFFNRPVVAVDDTRHSVNERRFVLHGITNAGRGLTLIFTIRGSLIRIISARDMSRKERREYEKAT